jgi:hypothetical protein
MPVLTAHVNDDETLWKLQGVEGAVVLAPPLGGVNSLELVW